MRAILLPVVAVVVALLTVTAAAPSNASGIHRLRSNYTPGEVITAHSRFGNGSIRSVVRPRRWGWQVKLPSSGNWTDCRRSCEETLRVQTVDYNEGGNSIDDGAMARSPANAEFSAASAAPTEFSF